ncbi:MAG: homoserine O-acetyltransferase [Bacteroidetes bacterium HGW-Bacteroidetes-21]|jgi:homoserine O-acetyltransferase|nr:MAG: homoserine O-acetyltransferase [Bacteroidetes bacterium HGW-Bacteroidetes-21]
MKHSFKYQGKFLTELGSTIINPEFAYHTYGEFNPEKNNIIWICHAYTANSDAADWWDSMVGEGKFYDPTHYFIVCVNYLGSCYGSTGPMSINPETGIPWYRSFPDITVRDMVKGLDLIRQHLGIEKIHTIIGGSIGGFQALEWSIINPSLFTHTVLIACSVKTNPWAIALNESQRMSIAADPTFEQDIPGGGTNGLKAARTIALLSYRNGKAYNLTQAESNEEVVTNFKASSYQRYQGEKLVKRFDAYTYFLLTKVLDSHNIARKRAGFAEVLKTIKAKTLVISITSDILFPPEEQAYMASLIPGAILKTIASDFGHDGFLIESELLSKLLSNFYQT